MRINYKRPSWTSPSALLPILLIISLTSFPTYSQTKNVRVTPILAKIDAIKLDIERLQNTSDEDPRDRLSTLKKMLRKEQEIGDQLNLGLKRLESEPNEGAESLLKRSIADQFRRLTEEIDEIQQHMDALRKLRSQAKADGLLGYEYDLRGYDELFSKLLQELLDNTERSESTGMASDASTSLLEETLKGRADRQADRLEITLDRIDVTDTRLQRAVEGDRSAIEKELVALEERQQRIVSGLMASVNMLKARNIATDQYSTGLLKSTGEISGDLLDSKILLSLIDGWLKVIKNTVAENGPAWLFKGLVFFVILFVAKLLSKIVGGLVTRAIRSSKMNFSTLLQQFFTKLAANAVFAIGFLLALAQLGIHLGPVLAGLGVAGLIVGFALQDTLSNFASGLMILIYRPYDVGDAIEAGGVSGKVQQMSLVSTTIQTFDNQRLIVPNNKIWGNVIRNVNASPTRRVDMVFGIGYEDDITAAEVILQDIVNKHKLILENPEAVIKLHQLGDSSVDFVVRPWVNTADYWTVYWDVTRAVKEQFTEKGISIPYPQSDVHLYQHQ